MTPGLAFGLCAWRSAHHGRRGANRGGRHRCGHRDPTEGEATGDQAGRLCWGAAHHPGRFSRSRAAFQPILNKEPNAHAYTSSRRHDRASRMFPRDH